MALLFMEGWENYSSLTEVYEDSRFSEDVAGTASFVTGRGGSGQAIRISNTNLEINNVLPQAATSTVFMGFAIRITTAPTSTVVISDFFDQFSTSFVFRINLLQSPTRIALSTGTSTHFSETGELNLNQWYYISFKVLIDDTVGTSDLYVDGALVDSGTGLDTRNSTGLNIKRFTIEGSTSNLATFEVDDMYFGDASGSDMTDQVGDVVIEQLVPDGAGSSTQFTPSAGSNYQNVDETTPDDDTTYNESSTVSDKDLFTCSNLSISPGSVYAVQVYSRANKQEAGNRTYLSKILSGATEGDGTEYGLADGTYTGRADIFENDPNGGGNWTESSVNTIEIGYEVVS